MSLISDIASSQFGSYDTQTRIERAFKFVLISVMAICIVVPFAMLVLQAFGAGDVTHDFAFALSFETFVETLTEPNFQNILLNTALFTVGSVTVAHVLGFVFAYILTRIDVPLRSTFHTLMFLPIFVSPLVLALGYLFLFSNGGFYHDVISWVARPISINNIWGMIGVGSIWLVPFAYSFISAGLQNIDPDMEAAGRLTGAREWTILREISVPLLKPFVLSSLFLTVLLTLQAVSVPAILGLPDRVYILATYILGLEGRSVPPPYSRMAVVGVVMVVISALIVVGIRRLIGDVSEYTVITGRSREHTLDTSPGKRWAAVSLLVTYNLVFVIIPFVQVLSVGMTSPNSVVPFAFSDLSIKWFVEVYNRSQFTLAVKNSVLIALVTASAAVVLTGVMSYLTLRDKGPATRALNVLTWIPISTPGVVLGLSYLWTVLIFDVGLYGSVFELIRAFIIRFSALGMRMNSSLISQQAVELDEQAEICGGALFSRLRNVIFPNAKTGMISVWVILFTMYMNELSTSIFLYGPDSRVITVTVFELWQTAQFGSLGALATIQVFITLTVVSGMIFLFDIDIRAV